MKKIFYITVLILSINISAQIAVDKTAVDGAGLLDFRPEATDLAATPNKGLILPKVTELDSGSVAGTIYLDATAQTVSYFDGTDAVPMITSNTGLTPLDVNLTDIGEGSVISDGTVTSNAPGVLVLDSSSKALILPKVTNPETSITNPSPGMMVYDLDSRTIAIYNGQNWAYWN